MRHVLSNFACVTVTTLALATVIPHASGGERADSLRTALKHADRIVVNDVEFGPQGVQGKPFEFRGAAKIATLVSMLDFSDDESGFHCMCLGDSTVTFFKGTQKLVTLSHHHGRSLRWNGGKWDGDSLFTPDTARAWREWFDAQGEPRFKQMHQRALAEAKREQEIHNRFMKAFPADAKPLFAAASQDGWRAFSPQDDSKAGDDTLSPQAKKIVGLFADTAELGTALAKALGSLAIGGAAEGSWSVSSSREQLVLECAKTLTREDLRKVLRSQDAEVLTGAARLFFFERLAAILPEDQRGPYAARLCDMVLQHDKCGNAEIAVRALTHFHCEETVALLERLASGAIPFAEQDGDYKNEPNLPSAACLLLARFGSEKAVVLAKAIEKSANLDEIDEAALRITRSFSGERGLLDQSVFEIDSYTIGFGALAALEREGGKAALDAVIMGGTTHSWAAIREEAVLTTERITGLKWFQNQKHERAEWHGEDIREWWRTNRGTYKATGSDGTNENG